MSSDYTQPQIIEQLSRQHHGLNSSKQQFLFVDEKPKYTTKTKLDQQAFFNVLDALDEYDQLIKQMNDLYTEGMIHIANVKFINPYSSLSTKGYKPTPAITKLQILLPQQQKQSEIKNDLTLHHLVNECGKINFTNSVFASMDSSISQLNSKKQWNLKQFAESDQSKSTANQLYSYQEQELMIQQQQVIKDCQKILQSQEYQKSDFIMSRFSIQNQKQIIKLAINKFNNLLKKIMEIRQKKIKIINQYDHMLNSI